MKKYKCEKCEKEYKSKSSLTPCYISGTGCFALYCKKCCQEWIKENMDLLK